MTPRYALLLIVTGIVIGAAAASFVDRRDEFWSALSRAQPEGGEVDERPPEPPLVGGHGSTVTAGEDEPPHGPEPVGTAGAGAAAGAAIEALRARDLVMPVEGVEREDLHQSFDEARGAGRHEAIDILAPRDTPVRAVEEGTIAKLFASDRGGLTIYHFDPAREYCYYYAHLERYAEGLREGQHVEAGEVIGYVGTSGNAPRDTPHLHFAIFALGPEKRWWEGTPVDPFLVLR